MTPQSTYNNKNKETKPYECKNGGGKRCISAYQQAKNKRASNRIILKVTKNYLQYTKNAEKLRSIYGFK